MTPCNKNIVIRADANHYIGMGHIMRCLSIADATVSVGCRVEFLIADDTISGLIQDRGYKATVLGTDYQKMDEELSSWPHDIYPGLIIVDSYYVTASYLSKLRDKMSDCGGKLVYIDDVLSFPYPVDILINYNAYASESDYRKLYKESRGSSTCGVEVPWFILGPIYAPLRTMFRDVPKRAQREKVDNILISTGGSDELHLAKTLIQYILSESSAKTDRVYHFLLGAMNADKVSIRHMAERSNHIVVHEDVTDMRGLIESCDLAISAAGSTLYEISSCGVPVITYSLADNQIPGAEAFERLGLAVNVGDLRDPSSIDPELVMSGSLDSSAVERIMAAVDELAGDFQQRVRMGKRMQEMIDGFGADRMVKAILSP